MVSMSETIGPGRPTLPTSVHSLIEAKLISTACIYKWVEIQSKSIRVGSCFERSYVYNLFMFIPTSIGLMEAVSQP